MDLALDPTTMDLLLQDGDLVLLDGPKAVEQHIRIRLLFFRGEWFLDSREGTPWLQEVLGQKTDEERAVEVVRKVLQTTPGVASVETVSVAIDSRRNMSIRFVVVSDEGIVLDSSDLQPFIVELN